MEPLESTNGWSVLHLFVKAGANVDAEAVVSTVKAAREADYQVATVSMLGHKADACFMIMGP